MPSLSDHTVGSQFSGDYNIFHDFDMMGYQSLSLNDFATMTPLDDATWSNYIVTHLR